MQPKDTFFSRKQTINCGGELLDLTVPKIMGILNITPDSFYDGGKYTNIQDILLQIKKMITDGCDILDIGSYSSRPGAANISVDEELNRLLPVLEIIRKEFADIIISVDTFRSEVAKKVVNDFNVSIINDISAGDFDEKMFETIAQLQVPYIIMHMQGNPENMQKNPTYDHVISFLMNYFSEKIDRLKLLGVNDVIIDPGFGFGKTVEHNYEILKYLDDFKIFELPVLVGVSRKSMINKVLEISPNEALNGTTVLNTLALIQGANILRVHDVKEAKETVKLATKFLNAKLDNWHE
ncbi:MAG TPA: dihydropteroate synthase [Bacteroidales bacterium]|jgi:dihydropteroate synthase|nr:dihydropteroate synthase [Bacteroidales bacterium]